MYIGGHWQYDNKPQESKEDARFLTSRETLSFLRRVYSVELNRYWGYWNYTGNEWTIITFKTSFQSEAQITCTKVEEIRLSAFFFLNFSCWYRICFCKICTSFKMSVYRFNFISQLQTFSKLRSCYFPKGPLQFEFFALQLSIYVVIDECM